MNWERAKSLIVVSLVLVNVFLSFLIYLENKRYTLTPEAEKAIYEVLKQNQISLYTELMREYKPQKLMEVIPFRLTDADLKRLFFDNQGDTLKKEEFDKIIFENDVGTVVVWKEDRRVSYESHNNNLEIANKEQAEKITRDFMRKLSIPDSNFILDDDHYNESEGIYVFEYRDKFNGYIIQSNFIRFVLSETGIMNIDLMYGKPSVSKESVEIASSDEALLVAIRHFNNIYADTPIFIKKMDLVYYQEENIENTEDTEDNDIKSIVYPYYRICILNSDEPLLVNAYMKTISDWIRQHEE